MANLNETANTDTSLLPYIQIWIEWSEDRQDQLSRT